jgi:hypothetical protein
MKRRAMALVAVAGILFLPAAAARAQTATIEARIEDQDVTRSSDDRPITLDPDSQQVIHVVVRNNGESPLPIRSIRLQGDVMGLTFFSYDTAVGMRVLPGRSEERRYEMDLFGLGGQAVGLIGSRVIALDQNRRPVAEAEMVADVEGSLGSVYGIFGMAISAFTLITFADVLIKLKRRRLPANRWLRALRFLAPGFGLGLSLIFTLSALRIYHPTTGKWVSLLVGSSAIFFLLGYLTPNPPEEEDEEELVSVSAPTPALGMLSAPVRPQSRTPSAGEAPAPAGTALAEPPASPAAAGGALGPPPEPPGPEVAAASPVTDEEPARGTMAAPEPDQPAETQDS